jgi:glucosamine 6-phosphate synthetase-like amidotransferase/phosphosugar isomerase protein
MCGIVGAIADRDISPVLINGLKRLEYRGYDSAGIAVLDQQSCIQRVRAIGKIKQLEQALIETPAIGTQVLVTLVGQHMAYPLKIMLIPMSVKKVLLWYITAS